VRFVAIIIIWISLIGGLFAWLNHTTPIYIENHITQEKAQGKFDIEITPTFDAKADPFALKLDNHVQADIFTVLLKGKPILNSTDNIIGGIPIVIKNVDNIIVGKNEFYIEAGIPQAQSAHVHAIRVRIIRDDFEVAHKSIWTTPGTKLQTTFILDVQTEQLIKDNRHDH